MRASGWAVVAVCGFAALAAADPAPKGAPATEIDAKPFRDRALVFQDAQGGTYVVVRDQTARVFYGTGKELHEQQVSGSTTNGDQWDYSMWAPRLPEFKRSAIQRLADGTYRRLCDTLDDVGLTPVTGDKAKALLASVKLRPGFDRRPYMLARDDSGIYYYVDRIAGGQGYRVFVGKKGAMKQAPLTDVAVDEAGAVFSTKTGDLRLVQTKDDDDKLGSTRKSKAKWVHGEKKEDLMFLNVEDSERLIFRDLGVYTFLGTLCDNV